MTPFRFLLTSLVTFVLICGVYFLAVDNLAVGRRDVEKYYKAFLLQASSNVEKKIVIDAGSNASHAIRSSQLEEYFGRYTINLADKADYPLLHKVYRLLPYLNSGDLLILPLEWNYYLGSRDLSDNYVSLLFARDGSGYFYYGHLPLLERIRLVYRHVPFHLALRKILSLNGRSARNSLLQENVLLDLTDFVRRIMVGDRGDFNLEKKNIFGLYAAQTQGCDDYILNQFLDKAYTVSHAFKADIRKIKRLSQESGVQIVFTWPTVVSRDGEKCYESAHTKQQLPDLISSVEEELSSAGFSMIGSLAESVFDEECFWDTYYHISHKNEHCAPRRTTSLIDGLVDAGIKVEENYEPALTNDILLAFVSRRLLLLSNHLPPVNTAMSIHSMGAYVSFLDGWGKIEDWGRWSIGTQSVIAVPVYGLRVNAIRVTGKYFTGTKLTGVWINDHFSGYLDLEDQVIEIPGELRRDLFLEIEFRHSETPSPAELGLSKDARKIKFGLTGLTLGST